MRKKRCEVLSLKSIAPIGAYWRGDLLEGGGLYKGGRLFEGGRLFKILQESNLGKVFSLLSSLFTKTGVK